MKIRFIAGPTALAAAVALTARGSGSSDKGEGHRVAAGLTGGAVKG
ncbi:hypothetical protein J4032_15415 [Streptomyces formicae]|uniref:Secreted protein n=1 Tax=Streptomyces formicae TaxID=1616117 RepID=A0ABY3WJF8_9ACTN|nr:hypothetical protein [Streptomyces formicae]UNM12724.1 hypothetical protein J4032_15415 [Streptomyces formicae]